ncbi:glycosyltransferase [Roseateles sp. BYS87W]|uniref:Glycosyltransferase n=1 Tax=Pelomonas baiyunensis TaxID=3299026 RepID=A0ABW7H3G9_9BURK
MPARKVLVFRSDYLPVSETFISDHLRHLRRYEPLVVAERDTPAKHRTAHEPLLVGQGRLGRWLFRRWGISGALDRLIAKQQPDLVHVHFLTDAVALLPYMERNTLPLVVTAHGYDAATYDEHLATFPEGQRLLALRERLIRRVDKVICVSAFIRDELLKRGFPADKLLVCHLGIDLGAFPPQPPQAAQRTGILSVGRLVEKKGMGLLIDAYARLPEALRAQHPLRIVGDGPLREALQAQAVALGVQPEFLGAQPRTVVLDLLQRSAVFCLASVRAANGDAEGMPIAIMEALASGAPTAIFDDQPMAPLLRQADAGLLPPAGHAAALAEQLHAALSSEARRDQLAERALQVVRTHFDLFRNVAALEEVYASINHD